MDPIFPAIQGDQRKILFAKYSEAQPFPFLLIDNFLPAEDANYLEQCFPKLGTLDPSEITWFKYDSPLEKKYAQPDLGGFPQRFQDIANRFNSAPFLQFLTDVTGIEDLIPDPMLYGGGLHAHARGGKLDVHADFNIHPKTKLDRRINVLLFLNTDWKEPWGGNLELWAPDMSKAVVKILPIFNRMVLFRIRDDAFHGVPDPIDCPDWALRKSLAFYYYTNGRPAFEKSDPHKVDFKRRPCDDPGLDPLREARKNGERYN